MKLTKLYEDANFNVSDAITTSVDPYTMTKTLLPRSPNENWKLLDRSGNQAAPMMNTPASSAERKRKFFNAPNAAPEIKAGFYKENPPMSDMSPKPKVVEQ